MGDFVQFIYLDENLFIFTVRNLLWLCFYRRLSVHRGGGSVCLSACWDTTPPGADTPYAADTTPGADTHKPFRSRHPLGADTPRSRHPPKIRPLLRRVRILLECILVKNKSRISFKPKFDIRAKTLPTFCQTSLNLKCFNWQHG